MARALVVDDEKLIVKGIRFSLEQDGMEVDCAYDGEEAINMAKQKEYDIVLLDVMLPKYDGYEVCQAIREFSEMPIIMLTAKGNDMDKILGLEYGADDYITKPFNILEVKARIKAILRRNSRRSAGCLLYTSNTGCNFASNSSIINVVPSNKLAAIKGRSPNSFLVPLDSSDKFNSASYSFTLCEVNTSIRPFSFSSTRKSTISKSIS